MDQLRAQPTTPLNPPDTAALLRIFIDQAPVAIAMFDGEMRYVAASQRWLVLCGLENTVVTGSRHADLLPDWPLPWGRHHEKSLLGIPHTSETDSLLRSDGRLDWLRWSIAPWHDREGGIGGSVMFAEVVTGRKQAEEREQQLMGERASRTRVGDILESISDAFLAVDRDWRFTFVNHEAARLLGRGQHDLVGRQLWSELPEAAAHPLHQALVRAFEEQVPFSAEELYAPTGQWFEFRVYPSREALSIYFRDVTARREAAQTQAQLQESLHRAERLSAMGSLVAGVAHQVRNPLFGITLALDALQQRLEGREDLARYFGTLEAEVKRVSSVMQDLLNFGKPATTARQVASLGDLAAGVVARMQPHAAVASVELVAEITPGLPSIEMDLERVPHVFQNLIDNAIQHSPAGGQVRIVISRQDIGSPQGIRCEVSDQGPGFQAEDLRHAFEPFYSKRKGGTGLGMAIVQRIVDEHGGRVWVSNQGSGGGVVTVVFPGSEAR